MKIFTGRMRMMMLLASVLMFVIAGCAKPPTEEISNAKLELQNAVDAGAQTYAADSYMSAEEALNQATALMEQKKYKQAREKAMDAMKLARQARVDAATNKNTMGAQAQEMYNMALDAVNKANQAGAYTYATAQMEDAQRTLLEAKAAYDSGDYLSAKQLSETALAKAREAEQIASQSDKSSRDAIAQQVQGEIADPGAMPRPYPTNHIVIKGETLWWIAEYKQVYDDPFQWPLIYKANRNQIKDPDLIFPDQNFEIPRAPEVNDDMVREAIRFAKSRGAWSLHDGK